jgi:7-keto-8-aminopelargonate synthetase-like enzyme
LHEGTTAKGGVKRVRVNAWGVVDERPLEASCVLPRREGVGAENGSAVNEGVKHLYGTTADLSPLERAVATFKGSKVALVICAR